MKGGLAVVLVVAGVALVIVGAELLESRAYAAELELELHRNLIEALEHEHLELELRRDNAAGAMPKEC